MEALNPSPRISASQYPAASKSNTEYGFRDCKRRRPPGEAPEPVRKSRRLQVQQLSKYISSTSPNKIKIRQDNPEPQDQLPSPSPSRTPRASSLHPSVHPPNTGVGDQKRKVEPAIKDIQAQSQVIGKPRHQQLYKGSTNATSERVQYWINELRWPKRDFEPDPNMNCPAPKRSRSSLSQDLASDSDVIVPDASDQKSRGLKCSPYQHRRYETLLENKGSYMKDSQAGVLATEKELCGKLLDEKQKPPSDSLFDDRYFRDTYEALQDENEQRVVRDINQLITPPAEILAIRGMQKLKNLAESTNAGWNNSIPFEGPRPQPDYSVGLRRTAFSEEQFEKFNFRFVEKTYFAATEKIFFPFLTCEVKCGAQALDIADRQNAHSMTVALNGIVELYRKVEREKELHRKALAFSISHDHRMVRIYAHYPEIEGPDTKYYRLLLKSFDIISEDGKDRWAANQFVRNVYDLFVPAHLDRIKSAVDQLREPALISFQPNVGAEDAESSQYTMAPTAPSSQEAIFKKPAIPRRGSVAELRVQNQRLMDELKQREDQFREQLEQEREESKQRHTELIDLLKQQISGKRLL